MTHAQEKLALSNSIALMSAIRGGLPMTEFCRDQLADQIAASTARIAEINTAAREGRIIP